MKRKLCPDYEPYMPITNIVLLQDHYARRQVHAATVQRINRFLGNVSERTLVCPAIRAHDKSAHSQHCSE